jgi:transposase InsO family protein
MASSLTCFPRKSPWYRAFSRAIVSAVFATVKKEEGERFPSYSDAKMALFDYIEVFYNQRRRHSTLGQISPAAFERGHRVA